MNLSRFRKIIKKTYFRIGKAFRNPSSPIILRFNSFVESIKLGTTKPQLFAYQLVGGKVSRFLPLFKDMDMNLRKSGMKANFKAYVSTIVLTALLIFTLVLILAPMLLLFIFHLHLISSLLFGTGASLLAGALTVIVFYSYPAFRADSLKRTLEDSLSFTAGYMAILAGAGVSPDYIFRSLSKVDISLAVSNESRTIVRDVELFGFDIISALEAASARTSSGMFKEFLEGFIATVHGGGSLAKYLRDRSRQYMELKKIALHRFSDTLGVLSEFYVTIMVAGSLIFVVMLSVMSMLGGGGSGLFNPRLLLYLLTYLGLPIGSIVFLIVLDMVSPTR
jgi:flagellar protein FlaJ